MWSHLSWCGEVAGGKNCISHVAHLLLLYCVVGSGRVRKTIKSIFIGLRNVFNGPGTQQDTEYTRIFSFRQYSIYITVVRFGPSVEICWPQCFWHCYGIRSCSEADSMHYTAKWQARRVFCSYDLVMSKDRLMRQEIVAGDLFPS
jgi:hypothetical protein